MFKTRLPISKEVIIVVLVAVVLVVLMVVNLTVAVPKLLEVYTPVQNETAKTPIDTNTVNNAIELLNGETP